MSEACEKCGADISFQGEEHTNCELVVRLRERLGVMGALIDECGLDYVDAYNTIKRLKEHNSL
jgi:hypothetical protein